MAANKITYSDKVGITPKETHINQVWDDDMNEIKQKVNDNADLFDDLEVEVDANTLDIVDIKADIVDLESDVAILQSEHKIGFLDYADLSTQTTPISVTGGAAATNIPNDGLGSFSVLDYPPDGVSQIWDVTGQVFDFNELDLGDMVDIRLNIEVTTTTANTELSVDLWLGSGGSAYPIPFITNTNFKNSGTYTLIRFNGIYMGNLDTINNGGVFKISSDNNITYKVYGWYCKIIKR